MDTLKTCLLHLKFSQKLLLHGFFPLDECFLASSVQFFSIHSSNFIREKVGALHKAEIEKKRNLSISDYFSERSQNLGFPLCLEKRVLILIGIVLFMKSPVFTDFAGVWTWSAGRCQTEWKHAVLSTTAIRATCATAQTSSAGLLCCKDVAPCPTARKSWTKFFFSELPTFWVTQTQF